MTAATVSLQAKAAPDYAALVEPRLGSNLGRWISFSSASLPFGMVNLSPDNRIDADWGGGYRYESNSISGFSHIHCWQMGGILVMPVVGAVDPAAGPDSWTSTFSHETEVCKPGDHRLTLDRGGIRAELTATLRVGYHRYTFPADEDAAIIVDLASGLGGNGMTGGALRQISPRSFEGEVTNEPTFRRPKPIKVYFVVQLDTDASLRPFDPKAPRTALDLGRPDGPVEMKVGISYTSVEAARENLRREAGGLSFDAARVAARDEWNRWLSRVEVEGGTETQRARFYTDVFFSLLGRRVINDAAGTYIDNTGPAPRIRQIPTDENGVPSHRHHNSDSFWGAQWTITPWWALAYPRVIDDFCGTFMDMYENGGLIPRGPAGGNYTFVMTSAQSTPLFATGLLTGIYRPADVDHVYTGLRKNHFPGGLMSKCGYEHKTCVGGGIDDYLERGYIPEDLPAVGFHNRGASQTIEHAFNDAALAQVARRLGKADDAALFERRSRNWRNVFDPSVGLMRPRARDGSWMDPFDPYARTGFTEGNAWTYTFYPTHDLAGLVEAFGSRERLLAKLEEALGIARRKKFFVPHGKHNETPIDFGNEPGLASLHIFQALGDHRRTQRWLREVFDTIKSGNSPTDSYAGDEDQGMMGSWNALVAVGLFSIDGAASDPVRYQITAPLFDRITFHLDPEYFPGRVFTIVARGNRSGAVSFIKSASLNGTPLPGLEFTHAQFAAGGELELELELAAELAAPVAGTSASARPKSHSSPLVTSP